MPDPEYVRALREALGVPKGSVTQEEMDRVRDELAQKGYVSLPEANLTEEQVQDAMRRVDEHLGRRDT